MSVERRVAAEPPPNRAHRRIVQIVIRAVHRPPLAQRGIEIRWDVFFLEGRLFRVDQVLRAQLVANLDEAHHGEDARQLVPLARLEKVGNPAIDVVSHHCILVRWDRVAGEAPDYAARVVAFQDLTPAHSAAWRLRADDSLSGTSCWR
jgi:hypothetical protein